MQHYHDELLRDMGIAPHRKRGAMRPVKELLAPYQPSDYAEVASGEASRRLAGSRLPGIRAATPAGMPARCSSGMGEVTACSTGSC